MATGQHERTKAAALTPVLGFIGVEATCAANRTGRSGRCANLFGSSRCWSALMEGTGNKSSPSMGSCQWSKPVLHNLPRPLPKEIQRGESPKGFFRLLRADRTRLHRVFANSLTAGGFEIGTVRKRSTHDVWNVFFRRGGVTPGCEAQTAKIVIGRTLKDSGVKCPRRDIDVSVIGSRISAAFIFHKGIPGSLVFRRGQECWCADEWP
jgi:hypothetical protein